MTKIEAIEREVEKLTREELALFRDRGSQLDPGLSHRWFWIGPHEEYKPLSRG